MAGAKAPQRSATQMLVPSRSTQIPAVEPHCRPSGSLPNCIDRYGLGSELVGTAVADHTRRPTGRTARNRPGGAMRFLDSLSSSPVIFVGVVLSWCRIRGKSTFQ